MKKVISILILIFAFNFSAEAQKKKRKEKKPKFTVEQHTELTVKKMTLALDLSAKQQNEIRPLIKAQAAEKMAAIQKRKELRSENKKPSSKELFEMKSKQLDNRIAFKNKMKNILNKEQYEKFKKMNKKRKMKGKKMLKEKRKKRKEK